MHDSGSCGPSATLGGPTEISSISNAPTGCDIIQNMPEVSCIYCKKKFLKSIRRFNEAKKFRWNFYCSLECQGGYRKRRRFVVCENSNCGKTFEKLISEIEAHNYCSRSCAVIINNQKFPKRGPGFKICKICPQKFKGVNLYCSKFCVKQARKRYNPQDLIDRIKLANKELGRIPAKREVPKLASPCIYAFGSWNNAVKAAGLQPNRSHENRMYKRTMTKAKDGHSCDSISEALIDNWLTDNGVKHVRDFPYPNSGRKADWAIDNTLFIEYFGLAGDSQRYDRDIKTKQKLCKNFGIKLVGIYPRDLYPKLNLSSKLKNLI